MESSSGLAELEAAHPGFKATLERALAELRKRPYLQEELRRKLEATQAETVSRFVIEFLSDRGFINDRETIRNHILHQSGQRGYGQERIKAELLERGAREEVVQECLQEQLGLEAELQTALQALAKRFGAGASRARAGRFLIGRGFSEELVEEALGRYFGSPDLPE
ncbi:MAG TPA: regulatory protein RecX [Fimbriimonadaceae bacterium]|nr:regulatory protein RecX [Fimbriimonadaceae bacterium]